MHALQERIFRGPAGRSWLRRAALSITAMTAAALLPYTALARAEAPQFTGGDMPVHPEGAEREAVLVLRVTVAEDGSVADAGVIDGFYTEPFAEAAVEAVRSWQFRPGTVDGEAVTWYLHEMIVKFPPVQAQLSVTPEFREAFEEAAALLGDRDHAAAEEYLRSLKQDTAAAMFEYAFINDNLFAAYLGQERHHDALTAIRRATHRGFAGPDAEPHEGALLPPDLLADALRKRFLLEASLGFNADALDTLAWLEELGGADPVAEQAAAVRALLDDDAATTAHGMLGGDRWVYGTARRTFTLVDVDGELEHVDALCERRYARLPFQPDVEWTLPEDWGDCALEFGGAEGTSFTIVEFVD